MKKRLLLMIIGIAMIINCSVSVSAETTSNYNIIEGDIKQDICVALRNIESQKSLFGLDTVDFESINIGEPVQTYEYVDNMFEECAMLYPLIYNDSIVLWAIEDSNTYQFTSSLTNEINEEIHDKQAFTIIYDKEKCYLFSEGSLTVLYEYGYDIEERSTLDTTDIINGLELSSIENVASLGYKGISQRAGSIIYSCDVEHVAYQTNLCWAASCAAISNCINDTNYDADDVSDIYWGENITGDVYTEDIPDVLDKLEVNNYSYRASIPSEPVMINNFTANRPIYGSFYNNTNSLRHGCVIYGINVNPVMIYIMDPIEEYLYIYNTNGSYSYYSASVGVRWIWDRACCYSWS